MHDYDRWAVIAYFGLVAAAFGYNRWDVCMARWSPRKIHQRLAAKLKTPSLRVLQYEVFLLGLALMGVGEWAAAIMCWFLIAVVGVAALNPWATEEIGSHWLIRLFGAAVSVVMAVLLIAVTTLRKPESEPWSSLQKFASPKYALTIYPFAMKKGHYADGEDVEGIKWNPHFTDLRVIITNPVDDDLQNLNLLLNTDAEFYTAVLAGNRRFCDLEPVDRHAIGVAHAKSSGKVTPSATFSGNDIELHDDQGNQYRTVATAGGYRLTCSSIAAHSSLKAVFATVIESTSPARPILRTDDPDLDLALGDRPSPTILRVEGDFYKGGKKVDISETLDVKDGN